MDNQGCTSSRLSQNITTNVNPLSPSNGGDLLSFCDLNDVSGVRVIDSTSTLSSVSLKNSAKHQHNVTEGDASGERDEGDGPPADCPISRGCSSPHSPDHQPLNISSNSSISDVAVS